MMLKNVFEVEITAYREEKNLSQIILVFLKDKSQSLNS